MHSSWCFLPGTRMQQNKTKSRETVETRKKRTGHLFFATLTQEGQYTWTEHDPLDTTDLPIYTSVDLPLVSLPILVVDILRQGTAVAILNDKVRSFAFVQQSCSKSRSAPPLAVLFCNGQQVLLYQTESRYTSFPLPLRGDNSVSKWSKQTVEELWTTLLRKLSRYSYSK